VPLTIYFARRTLKDKKKLLLVKNNFKII